MKPTIENLTDEECKAFLRRQRVGRMAFTFKDRVNIEPIHYVFRDGAIFGRTQVGEKVDVLSHHPWVAFEVDESTSMTAWESVVVQGRIAFPDPEGGSVDQALFDKGIAALRELLPATFTADDPMPERDMLFCIHILNVSGRRSVPAPVPA